MDVRKRYGEVNDEVERFVCCLFVCSYSQGVEYWIKSDP